MPVNEITAQSFIIARYTTEAYPAGHTFRLYFDDLFTVDANNVGVFEDYTDTAHPTGWSVKEVVQDVIDRFHAGLGIAALQVVNVELWKPVSGVNEFLGYDGADYSGVTAGAGDGIASAYTSYVFTTLTKKPFRFTMFETGDAKPQRFAGVPPPTADNGFLEWFFLRSAVRFVTNDNLRLKLYASANTGYNRRLARSYGRNIVP